ncbi:MAG: ZIP family metal transporter [Actinomycetota bacterium]
MANIPALGALAGFTIFLGLPMGRVRTTGSKLKAFLNATATGVLLFLLWDVLSKAIAPVDDAVTAASAHSASWNRVAFLGATFAVCLTVGLMSLVIYDRWIGARSLRSAGPGAMDLGELSSTALTVETQARKLALLIAIGIGLHNFSEGLAIGQSAAGGKISLALVLVIGFGLHNATEGFGIVAPMAGLGTRPSWKFLALMGLIGGGPTAIGTLVGQSFYNGTVFMAFLALAAGSILYVIVQLLGVARKLGHKELMMWGLLLGLFAGFATDMILTAAGA